jgi:hypothetical protein
MREFLIRFIDISSENAASVDAIDYSILEIKSKIKS